MGYGLNNLSKIPNLFLYLLTSPPMLTLVPGFTSSNHRNYVKTINIGKPVLFKLSYSLVKSGELI